MIGNQIIIYVIRIDWVLHCLSEQEEEQRQERKDERGKPVETQHREGERESHQAKRNIH